MGTDRKEKVALEHTVPLHDHVVQASKPQT